MRVPLGGGSPWDTVVTALLAVALIGLKVPTTEILQIVGLVSAPSVLRRVERSPRAEGRPGRWRRSQRKISEQPDHGPSHGAPVETAREMNDTERQPQNRRRKRNPRSHRRGLGVKSP
ncbi:hypothetical protein GCM10011574_42490 [Microbispora bryophytorum]|uniref:Uncharacterized protein n=1 Tax=Microbispora bryophytorum TaxID=1460882 RepID=A0A8H9H3H5_9ACTN|nr:hypothetical protein GCM10011574_42490 [Microbispora bryophytorum]